MKKKGAMKTKVEVFDKGTEKCIESYLFEGSKEAAKVDWVNQETCKLENYIICDYLEDADNGVAGLTYLAAITKEFFDKYIKTRGTSEVPINGYDFFAEQVQLGIARLVDPDDVFLTLKRRYDLSNIWVVQLSDVHLELFYSPIGKLVREKYYEIAFEWLTRNKKVKIQEVENEKQFGIKNS